MRTFHLTEILGACAVYQECAENGNGILRQSSNVPSEGLLFLLEECTLVSTYSVHLLVKYLLPASGRFICWVHIVNVTCNSIKTFIC